MAKRRRVLASVLLAVGLTAAAILVLWRTGSHADPVCRENYDRINRGMLKEEVIQILGPPTSETPTGRRVGGMYWYEAVTWEGGKYGIVVSFKFHPMRDEQHGAADKLIYERENTIDWLRRRWGLPARSNGLFEWKQW